METGMSWSFAQVLVLSSLSDEEPLPKSKEGKVPTRRNLPKKRKVKCGYDKL